jgi:hypothetical protein
MLSVVFFRFSEHCYAECLSAFAESVAQYSIKVQMVTKNALSNTTPCQLCFPVLYFPTVIKLNIQKGF